MIELGSRTMANIFIRVQMAAFACSALLAGCATPQTDALKQAEAEFQQAQSDPNVRENAAVPLREAKQALDQAKSAGGRDEVNHLAFLAERKVELAQAIAARRTAEENIETLSGVREKILLQARAEEAEEAEKEAAMAAARAECQSAAKVDPDRRPNLTPPVFGSGCPGSP
jgi:hypothetical protein